MVPGQWTVIHDRCGAGQGNLSLLTVDAGSRRLFRRVDEIVDETVAVMKREKAFAASEILQPDRS
jgi:microcompartment protein CcmK/EutM